MSEFVEKEILVKCPADGQPHAASDNGAWIEKPVTAMVNEGIGLAYYPVRYNGDLVYRVAHLASGKAISQPMFSAHSPGQAERWILRLDQGIDWHGDVPCLLSRPEPFMGYVVIGLLAYVEYSCSICHQFSDELRELADMQLCAKCYAPPRDDENSQPDLATALYRFTLALTAIVRCAADEAEVDLEASPRFEMIPSTVAGEIIVTVGSSDVFMTRHEDGQLQPGFVWTHGDEPYAEVQ